MNADIRDSSEQEPVRDIVCGDVTVGRIYHRPEIETYHYQACMHSPKSLVSAIGWGHTPQEALDDLTSKGMQAAVEDCQSLVETINKIVAG